MLFSYHKPDGYLHNAGFLIDNYALDIGYNYISLIITVQLLS
jgi:hypothetical protein